MDRMSRIFIPTLRQEPSAPAEPGLRLLLRGGYLRLDAQRAPLLLPLGTRLLQQAQAALERSLQSLGGQPIHPAPMEESGATGAAATAVQTLDLLAPEMRSYRALPKVFYGMAGSPSGPQFLALSLAMEHGPHPPPLHELLAQAMEGMGLGIKRAEALPPSAEGGNAWAITIPGDGHGVGALGCAQCAYRALEVAARRRKEPPPAQDPLPLRPVETPQADTIAALARQINLPTAKTAKAMFYLAEGEEREPSRELVIVILRGDMELNEHKLRRALGGRALRPANEQEIRAAGAVPGYGSAIGIEAATVVVDDLIPRSPNLVAGANREGFHLLNANYGRDFQAQVVADLVQVAPGDPCPQCGAPLESMPVAVLGSSWSYAPEASAQAGWSVADETGKPQGMAIGVGVAPLLPLLAALAARYKAEKGLHWPARLAPYPLQLILLPGGEKALDPLARALDALGIPWLVDDRDERAGVKFNDADWIGAPLRLLLGRRSLEKGGVEARRAGQREGKILPLEAIPQWVQENLDGHSSAP